MKPLAIFDLDGTIADTNRDLIPALNHATALDGLEPVSLDEVGYVVGQGALKMIEKAFALRGRSVEPDRLQELFAIFLRRYEDHIADESVIFEGFETALDALEDDGWAFAVCTNKPERLAKKLLAELGIADRFAFVAGAETFERRKPDPSHITNTIDAAGGASKAVMIGDSISDSAAAQAVPIPVVLFDFGYSEHDVRTLNADAVLSHYRDLPETLNRLI